MIVRFETQTRFRLCAVLAALDTVLDPLAAVSYAVSCHLSRVTSAYHPIPRLQDAVLNSCASRHALPTYPRRIDTRSVLSFTLPVHRMPVRVGRDHCPPNLWLSPQRPMRRARNCDASGTDPFAMSCDNRRDALHLDGCMRCNSARAAPPDVRRVPGPRLLRYSHRTRPCSCSVRTHHRLRAQRFCCIYCTTHPAAASIPLICPPQMNRHSAARADSHNGPRSDAPTRPSATQGSGNARYRGR